ncbi:MAG: 50S ribosomal protein L5 [Candidatus Pacebacteria bacterium]|nr:50S ribosomal protein L5 [Candidatus Paceibacterota bacterium]MBP9700983.1 50S ribosomal protein L5 [Candidatus Paceibacterota bacterium]
MEITKQKQDSAYKTLGQFNYKAKLAAPRLLKIVVASGTGSGMKKDREKNNTIIDRLSKITGQKPTLRIAKKSVASFKVREGDPIGVSVTLRGARMQHFLDKLINVAIPRTKDFRGIERKTVDNIGNMTIGIKEHSIFPETSDEDLRDVFGFAVTLVSSAKNKEEALAFFEHLGIPFKKEDAKK